MSEDATLDEFTETDYSESRVDTPIGRLPSDWGVEWLNDVTNINPDGFSEDDWPSEAFEYISLSEVSEGEIMGSKTVSLEEAPSRAQRQVRQGDVLVGTVRPKQVSHGFVTAEHDGKICSSGFGVLRTEPNLNSHYLIQEILSHRFFSQMEAYVAGSGYPAVKISDLKKHRVSIPPLKEQRKIATVLNTVDQAIQKTGEIIGQIERTKSGLLQDIFEPDKYKPESLVKIEDLGDWGSGSTPSKDNQQYWGGSIPWLSPKDIFSQEKSRISETEIYLTEEGANETSIYPADSVAVVVRSGVLDRMLPIVKTERDMAVNQDMKILEPDAARPEYLLYAFQAHSNKIRQRSRTQGTTWVDSIQMLPFMRHELPVPDEKRQNEIVEQIRPFDELLHNEKEGLDSLKRLKQGLMQDLLSGTVRTTDTNIEVPEEIARYE